MITATDYAALTYGSTPATSSYVKDDGRIIGAVIKGHDGWIAFEVENLLNLTQPLGRDFATKDEAVTAVVTMATVNAA